MQRLQAHPPLLCPLGKGCPNVMALVDLAKGQSLLVLISLRQDLEDLLGCPVDLTEAETLHPLIRRQILNQALTL